jgi:uncharacterized protein Smg (DUF494 family)
MYLTRLCTPNARSYSSPNSNPPFDTYKFVQELEHHGFTQDQSEAIMQSLSDVISQSMQTLKSATVSKEDQEKVRSFLMKKPIDRFPLNPTAILALGLLQEPAANTLFICLLARMKDLTP